MMGPEGTERMRRLTDIDLRLLMVFVTIADCNGFAKAQTALNMAQSTLSTHLSSLEDKLGSRLCERGRRGFRLTQAGEETYRAIQDLLHGFDRFDATMRRVHGRENERLRIGVIDTVSTNEALGLPDILRRFAERHPNVFLDIEIMPPEQLQQSILQGRRDMIIGASLQHIPSLTYHEMCREEHNLYCGKDHPWFDRPDSTITQDDFQRARFSVRSYQFFDDAYRLGRVTASASVTSMEGQELLILSGQFVGFLPCHKGKEWVQAQRMRPIKPDSWMIHSRFYLAYDSATGRRDLKTSFLECSHHTAPARLV